MGTRPTLSEVLLYFSSKDIPIIDIIDEQWVPANKEYAAQARGADKPLVEAICIHISKDFFKRLSDYRVPFYAFSQRKEHTNNVTTLLETSLEYLENIVNGRKYRNFYDFLAERQEAERGSNR